ncbi:hypothetical protein INS49_015847 [Diaporthe citri]|uniref:uncharacterized protein n=1 Tax=Diaporthe citri TaxID=83186 RepID=UPI001C827F4F|nr:uncharacterized protein INS49_015847 [Diaporthe citri]KAG6356459.1 hypothetical protein INS49_015847 [Diaporthe citri]
MKASLFLFSVLAAIAAAQNPTDVVNDKPSPTVKDNTKTVKRDVYATPEADSIPTVLEEREAETTGEVGEETK